MKALEELIEWARDNHPEMYYKVKMERMLDEGDVHFCEGMAKYVVGKMHHTLPNGNTQEGEHWTMEQVKAVKSQRQEDFSSCDNCYDLYVALHIFWHDLSRSYKQTIGDGYEQVLIDDAVVFFFKDEDGPHGKVFRYVSAMMA